MKGRGKYRYYLVRVLDVPGCSPGVMEDYIQEAVANWGGAFEPRYGGDHGDGTIGNGHPLGPPCVLAEDGNTVVLHLGRFTDANSITMISERVAARVKRGNRVQPTKEEE